MGFKICSIGCGEMAGKGHGPSYRKYSELNPEVELAGCCDLDRQKASDFKEKFGFRSSYTDMDKMFDTERPDAVCLIAPVNLTAQLSIKILERGYPLMMEKPPGMNGDETLKMIDAAVRNSVPTQVAFNRRYMPLVDKLMRKVSDENIPRDSMNIRYTVYRVGRKDADFSTTAIHGIDTVKFIAGSNYKNVNFHYQELPEEGSGVANIFLDCMFESGTTAQLNFCPVTGIVLERLILNYPGNTVFLNLPMSDGIDVTGSLVHFNNNKVIEDMSNCSFRDGNESFETGGFYAENAAFFDDIRAGRKPHGDIQSGLQSVLIAECIRNRKSRYEIAL